MAVRCPPFVCAAPVSHGAARTGFCARRKRIPGIQECRARVSFHFAPRIPGDKAARAIHARAWRRGASLRPARPCRRGPSRAGFGPFAARGGGWVGWLRRGWFVGVCGGCSFFGGVAGAFGGGAAGGGGAGRAAAGGGRLVVPVLRFFAVPSGGVGVWRGVRLAVLPGRGG